MLMLKERLQVLIDTSQRDRLQEEADRRGTSVATLVREAIDHTFPPRALTRAEAVARFLDAEPMELGDPDELRVELDAIRARELPV